MAAASRSLDTALEKARFASGLLHPSYTTSRDTTISLVNSVLSSRRKVDDLIAAAA
jgi:hypothetical protein